MKYEEVTNRILKLGVEDLSDFKAKANIIESELNACSTPEILDHLDHAGIIPECFNHDSTEEKLFARYCDALVARCFCILGLDASVIQERSDAADVIANCEEFSLVGDAKAFRLSRTAKNQKDFKVEALDKWRKGADYACLVCPIFQYPKNTSQIYLQAIRYNVTLLSYTHLSFMIKNNTISSVDPRQLADLWRVGRGMTESKDARVYWNEVKKMMLLLLGRKQSEWKKAVRFRSKLLTIQAKQQIIVLEEKKKILATLNHDILVSELIRSQKIDSKISTIREYCD